MATEDELKKLGASLKKSNVRLSFRQLAAHRLVALAGARAVLYDDNSEPAVVLIAVVSSCSATYESTPCMLPLQIAIDVVALGEQEVNASKLQVSIETQQQL